LKIKIKYYINLWKKINEHKINIEKNERNIKEFINEIQNIK